MVVLAADKNQKAFYLTEHRVDSQKVTSRVV